MVGTGLLAKHNRFAIEVDGELCVPYTKEMMDRCVFLYKHQERWIEFNYWLCNLDCATDEDVERIKAFANYYFKYKGSE
jgi:hypothetical protein|nr:MAG TPA: hypothetical protein [Caudoviricetes sp.]